MKIILPFPLSFTLALLLALPHSRAEELFVDSKAPAQGDGSSGSPYRTVSQAVEMAKPGTTITVKGGVYPETVQVERGGTPEAPLVIRGAAGERVEVTGFDALTGWKDEAGGLFSLTTPERVNDLYVGGARQRPAQFPDVQSVWTKITQVDTATGNITLESFPELTESDERSLCLATFRSGVNVEALYTAKSVDRPAKTFCAGPMKTDGWEAKAGDPALLYNAPTLIKHPGDWACQIQADGSFKTYYKPKNPGDLERTRTRRRETAFYLVRGKGVSHVTLENLEITGATLRGLFCATADNLTVRRCVVYNNGFHGIQFDGCSDTVIESCIVFANGNGIGLVQGKNHLVKGCEVYFNDTDGIVVSGRKPQPDNPVVRAELLNNYVHGNMMCGHGDNTQTFSWVKDLAFRNNIFELGGQNLMTSETEGVKFLNNIFFGSVAYQIQGTALEFEITHNTFLFGAGGVAVRGDNRDFKIFRNIFYQVGMSYSSNTGVTSGDNLFWMKNQQDPVVSTNLDKKFSKYNLPDEIPASFALETRSQRADPGFKNMPRIQVAARGFEGNPGTLVFSKSPVENFAVGDTIEINGDRVARKVSGIDGNSLAFSPPLPVAPLRHILVWNWGPTDNIQPDCSFPSSGEADKPGATLDIQAYREGRLDGSGTRSLPNLSPEAKAAWPDPNNFVFPYFLPVGK